MAKKSKRGLACVPAAKRREIAALGGRRAHALRKAHRFSSEEGKAARQVQLGKARDMEETLLRLRVRLRSLLGPSPGPSPLPPADRAPEGQPGAFPTPSTTDQTDQTDKADKPDRQKE